MAANAVISIRGLQKKINRKAILNELNLSIVSSENVAILGPNGAGKTTLLRILASIMRPDAGEIRVCGYHLPTDAIRVRQHLGVVLHQPMLYHDLTAEENLRFYSRLYGQWQTKKRIGAVLEEVGLTDRSQDLVRTYSRGMQQRLAIARAILHEPEILLLDEPLTGLDTEAAKMLSKILYQMKERGGVVVMTGHSSAGLSGMADRTCTLENGRIVLTAQIDEGIVGGNSSSSGRHDKMSHQEQVQ
ncbi:MAG: heme ABC exporter ATP-binding protein CcmA [Leptolinea sp.]|jgi:heme exporter protein A|nr:heme ABC exporter ATP-binding protein CcmA [Leptolinea sp.]